MGESDDEFSRRRGRDKFVKERNDFQHDKRRDYGSLPDRRNYGNSNRAGNDYRNASRSRPDLSPPPAKRNRRDWDEGVDSNQSRRDATEIAVPVPSGNSATIAPAPSLMSFKQFLTTQDDSISDEAAIAKYQDYKMEFKRQQLHAFFIAHKDEEWFKVKYHPEESTKRKVDQLTAIQRRLEVFQELYNKNFLNKSSLDSENARNLVKLMDAVVIKLEGGTDEDVATLEKLEVLLDDSYNDVQESKSHNEGNNVIKKAESTESTNKIKVKYSNRHGEDGAISDSEASEKGSVTSAKSPTHVEQASEEKNDESELNGKISVADDTEEGENENQLVDERENSPTPDAKHEDKTSRGSNVDSGAIPKMSLHKTSSIFFRNLSPAITKNDIETLCKRFPGFLRVSLAEPLADRRYYRRGWVTFRRDVNIKEICWNLNSIRLKDCDMGPIVNRDLTKRIRVANGVTSHKLVVQNDLRLAAKLVQIYDKKFNLWQDDGENLKYASADQVSSSEFALSSRNPLLKNITDYLIEEASAEEEELLGLSSATNTDSDQKVVFERDGNILKVLDRILLYLRIVHSIDYYNHGEYPCEDEMPNRCGLIHVRGPQISSSQFGADVSGRTLVSVSFVNEFCKNFENHLQPLLQPKDKISDEEIERIGRKDPEKEVEAFITANSQELAKDKWLCPLSGKKFKGPEFIRKHIQNKHAEKLDEVRNEVVYFNNYLLDSKRPSLVEMKPHVQQSSQSFSQRDYGNGSSTNQHSRSNDYDRSNRDMPPPSQDYHRPSGGGYRGSTGDSHRGQNDYGGGGSYRRDNYQRRDFGSGGGYGGGRSSVPSRHFQNEGRRDPRVPVTYTDLDAPEDVY